MCGVSLYEELFQDIEEAHVCQSSLFYSQVRTNVEQDSSVCHVCVCVCVCVRTRSATCMVNLVKGSPQMKGSADGCTVWRCAEWKCGEVEVVTCGHL